MMLNRFIILGALCATTTAIPALAQEAAAQAQPPTTVADQRQQPALIYADVLTQHAECLYFTKEGERFRPAVTNPRDPRYKAQFALSRMTEDVAHRLADPPQASAAPDPSAT